MCAVSAGDGICNADGHQIHRTDGSSAGWASSGRPAAANVLLSPTAWLLLHDSRLAPVGAPAPDFELHSTPDQTVKLDGFSRAVRSCSRSIRPTGVRSAAIRWRFTTRCRREFAEYNAQLLGVSVDGAWCHRAFADARKLKFPLLADFEPKGEVSRRYGAYRQTEGFSERALFVIDAAGVVRWNYLSPIGVNPGADGIFEALEALTPEQRGSAAGAGKEHP